MTLRELAIEILKNSKEPLTAKEIWNLAEDRGLMEKLNAKGKSPYATFRAVLYNDEKRKYHTFVAHTDDPKKFSLKSEID